jgi:hypothetical protein
LLISGLTASLAYEAAVRDLRHDAVIGGPYRKWLHSPFLLDRRAALPGINTLTVRLSKTGPKFFIHKRGVNAGLSMGVFHVAPAGEFQPQTDDPTIWKSDLSILHNIIRECAEEFLGVPEAAGRGGVTIDFSKDAPYKDFLRAYAADGMKIYYLGTGLDPLSWKPEILTICIFDDAAFAKPFAAMITDKTDEGTGGVLLAGSAAIHGKAGRQYSRIDFTPANIAQFADATRTLPSGVACLRLAARLANHLIP